MLSLSSKSFTVVNAFLAENRPLVFKFLMKKIKHAIKHNIDKIDLFEFVSTTQRHVAILKAIDYESTLLDAIKEFIRIEDYESAGKAQEILSLLRTEYVNRLLNDIKPEG